MGMMFLWPIFMLLFLALPVAVVLGVYLMYQKAKPASLGVPASSPVRACTFCGRFLQEGWVSCPYCGKEVLQSRK